MLSLGQQSSTASNRKGVKKIEDVVKNLEQNGEKLSMMDILKKGFQEKLEKFEYESDSIEMYNMISNEFDYEEVRKSEVFGIKQYKDSIYRGELNGKRKRHGLGVIVYNTGRIYEGEWKDDKRFNRGFELFVNGNTYQGEYIDGKAHGKGIYTWQNGEVYDGEWIAGTKQGYGVWKGIHGDSYIG